MEIRDTIFNAASNFADLLRVRFENAVPTTEDSIRYTFFAGLLRFNELQRSIPDISKKMLIQTLRKLERRGLLDRLVHPVVPPHVDYTLTVVGTKFAEAVALICEWAQKNKGILKRVNFND